MKTRTDREQIIQALREGEKYIWIQAHFNVPAITISRYRRKFNIPNRYKVKNEKAT